MVLWRLADSMPSGMLMPRVIILSALRLTAGCIILRLSWSPVQSLKEALGNVVKMGGASILTQLIGIRMMYDEILSSYI